MNTKGLVELIVLNIGNDRKVLNDKTFAIMVLMALFNTFITTPVVMAVYKPARRKMDYRYRTIERKSPDTQLRILACFHSARNIPSMINLFEASRGVSKRERLSVYALHLMELSERSSAILMVHKAMQPETIGEISPIDVQESTGIETMSSAEKFLSQFEKIPKDGSVRYEEKAVGNVTEAIDAIRAVGHCNLILVGRMPQGELAMALWRRSECPELGPVGSLLISPDFSMTASVLVIQQYNGYMPPYLAADMDEESPDIDSESS
ncbi:hypothetical protein V6N13_124044 [Hibiscus sabdariffa]